MKAQMMTAGAIGLAVALGGGAALASTIIETLRNEPDFKTFVQAIEQTDYGAMLDGSGSYTVFAPTDAAFERLPETTVGELMTAAFAEELEALVGYHIVENETLKAESLLGKTTEVDTLLDEEPLTLDGTHGEQLFVVPVTLELVERDGVLLAESTRSDQPAIELDENGGENGAPSTATMNPEQKEELFVFPARVTATDMAADNGLIHAVDAVLLPKTARMMMKLERKENQLGNQSGG
jgi:uncharacterized surface protein with fasciclin (FAS1) repeats